MRGARRLGLYKSVPPVPIDVGTAAINRASELSTGGTTLILKDNPANESGTITSIEIWAATDLANCEIGIFTNVSGTNFTSRSNTTLGAVTSGSKQTFSGLSLAVQTGDYLGIYFSSGTIEMASTGGEGYWYLAGDNIPCSDTTFTYTASTTRILSLYGIGST